MDFTVLLTAILAVVSILGGLWKIVDGFNSRLEATLENVNNTLKANTSLLFKRFDDHKEATDKKLIYMTELADKKYAHLGICDLTRVNFEKVILEMKENATKANADINRKLDILLEERRNK
jgi:hypothetical protein